MYIPPPPPCQRQPVSAIAPALPKYCLYSVYSRLAACVESWCGRGLWTVVGTAACCGVCALLLQPMARKFMA